jgi:hypothetical protein
MQNTYRVIGRDEKGHKIKMIPEDILFVEKDMRLAKKYGPEFIKCIQNSSLYKAQMFHKWVENYKINLEIVRCGDILSAENQKSSGIWHLTAQLPNIHVKWHLRSGGPITPCL